MSNSNSLIRDLIDRTYEVSKTQIRHDGLETMLLNVSSEIGELADSTAIEIGSISKAYKDTEGRERSYSESVDVVISMISTFCAIGVDKSIVLNIIERSLNATLDAGRRLSFVMVELHIKYGLLLSTFGFSSEKTTHTPETHDHLYSCLELALEMFRRNVDVESAPDTLVKTWEVKLTKWESNQVSHILSNSFKDLHTLGYNSDFIIDVESKINMMVGALYKPTPDKGAHKSFIGINRTVSKGERLTASLINEKEGITVEVSFSEDIDVDRTCSKESMCIYKQGASESVILSDSLGFQNKLGYITALANCPF